MYTVKIYLYKIFDIVDFSKSTRKEDLIIFPCNFFCFNVQEKNSRETDAISKYLQVQLSQPRLVLYFRLTMSPKNC